VPLYGRGAESPSNTTSRRPHVGRGLATEAYLRTKWHLDPCSRLATIDVGQKLGAPPLWVKGAGSPCSIMWPGPRPTCMPSFILIRPTVRPQCTNVTDRQDRTDRQQSNSIGQSVFGRLFLKRFALCYWTVVLSCLSVCNVRALWPNGWTDQDETWRAARPLPWPR